MVGGVVIQACVGRAATGAALIVEHDVVALRIPKTAMHGIAAPARSAVEKYRWLSTGISAAFIVDAVLRIDREPTAVKGLDRRVNRGHGRTLAEAWWSV